MKKLVVYSLVVFISGCATIFRGNTQHIFVDSNVKGADVIIDGESVGKTPFEGEIPRKFEVKITVTHTGFTSRTMYLDSEFEPVFWGNLISCDVFGTTTDFSSGAMYKYSPSNIQIDLEPTVKFKDYIIEKYKNDKNSDADLRQK